MSDDSVTEVTTQSWGSRLGGAIKGVLLGIVLFIAGFPVLFWNEGRTVNRTRALKEGASAVVSAPSDQIAPDLEGKLVHVQGEAKTEESLVDAQFSVNAPKGAFQLIRKVEMYQWVEESHSQKEKKLGGKEVTTTKYTYKQAWRDVEIDSSSFKNSADHQNPGWIINAQKWIVPTATMGAFQLSEGQIRQVGSECPLKMPALDQPLPAGLDRSYRRTASGFYKIAQPALEQQHGKTSAVAQLTNQIVNAVNTAVESAGTPNTTIPATPQIGDVRVRFYFIPANVITLIGKQQGDQIVSYETSNGGSLLLQANGKKEASAMFKHAEKSNMMMAYLLRLLGFFMMFIGLQMFFKPLSVLADVIPILGNIVGAGTGIISFLIAISCSLITIAIAWISYRPMLGIPVLVVAVALLFIAWKKVRTVKAAKAAKSA